MEFKKVYSDNPYVDEMVYYTTQLGIYTTLKLKSVADDNETLEILKEAGNYIACIEGNAILELFDSFPYEALTSTTDVDGRPYGAGLPEETAKSIVTNPKNVFKLNEEYYVCVELHVWSTEDFAAHYEYTKMLESNVKEMFGIEESLNIIITEAEQFEVPDYDYPHWLEDENANKLIGFNSPIGMNRVESESEGILMRTANGNKAFQIMITDSYYASIIKKGRDEANEDSRMIYTEKGEIETIYGNIKLYELHDTYTSKEYNGDILIKEEENHFYMDYGLLNFKGKYILFTYVDYTKQDGYTGELEEIIKNQLFVQE